MTSIIKSKNSFFDWIESWIKSSNPLTHPDTIGWIIPFLCGRGFGSARHRVLHRREVTPHRVMLDKETTGLLLICFKKLWFSLYFIVVLVGSKQTHKITWLIESKQEGNSLKDLRRMNDLNDLNNYYTVIGTYSIVVIKWSDHTCHIWSCLVTPDHICHTWYI